MDGEIQKSQNLMAAKFDQKLAWRNEEANFK